MFIYVLVHERFPEYVKIGIASNLRKRYHNYCTAYPIRPKFVRERFTPFAKEVEKELLNKYKDRRDDRREWIKMPLRDFLHDFDETLDRWGYDPVQVGHRAIQ